MPHLLSGGSFPYIPTIIAGILAVAGGDALIRPNSKVRRIVFRAWDGVLDRLAGSRVAPLQKEIAELKAHLNEVKLEEYRTRRAACAALLSAVRHNGVMATARHQAEKAAKGFPSPQNIGRVLAESEVFKAESASADRSAQEAFAVLNVEEEAAQVLDLYRSLPFGKLYDAPDDPKVQQVWNAGVVALRHSIFAYLRPLKEELGLTDNGGDRQL